MIETLVVPFWRSCPAPDLRLLGVEFRDRIVLQSRRSGFRNLLLLPQPAAIRQLPEEFLLLFPNLLLTDRGWSQLKALEPAPDTVTSTIGTDSIALVRCNDTDFISTAFRESRSYQELLTKLCARLGREFVPIEEREWIAFRSESDRPQVEKWMLRGLIKDSEGFMSRHFERKISLAVTRQLVETRMTPNTMTAVSVGIGLVSAPLFALPRESCRVLGALLFWLHSVLDGCDGELARLKFAESRWGGLLDFWGDNVVHSAVFSAIAAGMSLKKAGTTPLALAACAVGGTLLSASLVYWRTMRRKRSGGPLFASVCGHGEATRAAMIADLLARRDFIYLVVALACLRRVDWFLWMGAVGAPVYFLVLAGLSLKTSPSTPRRIPSTDTSQ